jgi:hypothetical protein
MAYPEFRQAQPGLPEIAERTRAVESWVTDAVLFGAVTKTVCVGSSGLLIQRAAGPEHCSAWQQIVRLAMDSAN